MSRFCAFVLLLLSTTAVSTGSSECGLPADDADRAVNVTVVAVRRPSGEWTASFLAEKIVGNVTDSVVLDVRHSVVTCGDRSVVRIRGTLRDGGPESYSDASVPGGSCGNLMIAENNAKSEGDNEPREILRFHSFVGRDVSLLDDALSARRKDELTKDRYAGLITNRPLEDGELFQVRLNKLINKWTTYSLAIGVISKIPTDTASREFLHTIGNGTCYLRHDKIYKDGEAVKVNYPTSLVNLPVGTLLGVKWMKNKKIHFFRNGVDQGLAAVGVQGPVYGFFELVEYCYEVSIV